MDSSSSRNSSVLPFITTIAVLSGAPFGATSALAFSSHPAVTPSPAPSASPATQAMQPGPGELWLSKVIREQLLGIGQEPEEARKALEARAKTAAAIRAGRATIHAKKEFLEACDQDVYRDPLCGFADPKKASEKNASRRARAQRALRRGVAAVKTALVKGQLDKLQGAGDREIGGALRTFQSFGPLERVSDQVVAGGSCANPLLGFFLGAKAEEFLPNPAYRKRAIQLYESTTNCGDNDSVVRSRYRASLLHIWENDCAAAVPHLEFLSGGTSIRDGVQSPPSTNRDYRTRALYWKAQCEGQLGKKEVASGAKEVLLTEHPLSLHSLLVDKETPGRLKAMAERADVPARFRSETRKEINGAIAAAEALISIGETAAADRILDSVYPEYEGAEQSFQLYVSYLYNRVGDNLSKFKLMSALFRDNSSLISRAALELYYPKRKFGVESGLDELLVLSLIRQESAFNDRARSPVGALGLMQLMPRTARRIERVSPRLLFNPDTNVRIGSKYFAGLLKKFGGDAELALAAYNAGPERVEEWLKRYPVSQRVLFIDLMPFRETREYVSSIVRNYYWYSLLYSTVGERTQGRVPAAVTPAPSTEPMFKLLGT